MNETVNEQLLAFTVSCCAGFAEQTDGDPGPVGALLCKMYPFECRKGTASLCFESFIRYLKGKPCMPTVGEISIGTCHHFFPQ